MLAALGLLSQSCGPEGLLESSRQSVSFVVTAATAPATKATFYDTDNLPASLGLLPYTRAEGSTSWALYPSGGGVTPLSRDGRETGVTSGKWIPAPEARLLWPREGYIRYYAYAPYVGGSSDPVSVTTAYPPTLSYTVPAAVSAQTDLLVTDAESTKEYSGDPGWRKIDVPLKLVHALTAVRFRIIDGLSIESVSVGGVKDAGSLDLSNTAGWTNLSGSATYTLTNLSLGTGSGSGLKADADYELLGYNVVEDEYILLLLPQSPLASGATITATVSDGTNDRTITADISGQEYWKPGTLVTYTITRRAPTPDEELSATLALDLIEWKSEVGVAAWDGVLWNAQRVIAPDIERIHWD